MIDNAAVVPPKRRRIIRPDYREPADFEYATTAKVSKMDKSASFAVPRVVNTIWLSNMCAGKIPKDRFANLLSFSKQFAADDWRVNIWVNKPVIWHRECCRFGPGNDSAYRGLALETHASTLNAATEHKHLLLRNIRVCEDWQLYSQLDAVNKSHYDLSHDHYNLSYLTDLNSAVVNDTNAQASPIRPGVYDAQPFRKSLLDYYREKLVGRHNFAAASDYLRVAAQTSGGVYVDSDTKAAGVHDQVSHFDQLYAPSDVILSVGWSSGYNNDLFANLPDSSPVKFMQLDQYYNAARLEQLPYVVWSRETDGTAFWSKRTVELSPAGLKMSDRELSYCTHGLGNKNLVSLADTARFPGYFYKQVNGAIPGIQQGLNRHYWQEQVNENGQNLRFLLTLHSPGPWTLNRMHEAFELSGKQHYLFENRSPDNPQKRIDPDETLSVTEWGGLSRVNTISWDCGGEVTEDELRSYDDSELGEMTISKNKWLSERDHSSGSNGST